MAYFDFLNSRENKIPNYDMEYIYRLNMIWKPGILEHFDIAVGTIMIHAIRMDNYGYQFECKDTGEIYETSYGWALAENTSENVQIIKEYEQVKSEYDKIKKLKNAALNHIKTLE